MKQIVLFDGTTYKIPNGKIDEVIQTIEKAQNLVRIGDDLINKSAIMKIADAPKIPTWDGYKLKKDREDRYYFLRDGKKVYLGSDEENAIVFVEEKEEVSQKQLGSGDELLALAQQYGIA